MNSSEIITSALIDEISKLKQPCPEWCEDEDGADYEIDLEKSVSYNQAIDDVIKVIQK